MFRTLKNAWSVPDIRKKMLFTLLIVVLYRFGASIIVPYINGASLSEYFAANTSGSLFQYFNMLSGDAFSKATLFALGVSPYITASIVIQLLTIAIPALERLSKSGPEGQAKIASITRYVTIALALITSYGYYLTVKGLSNNGASLNLVEDGWFPAVVIIACYTAGATLVMWIGERIDDYGIGNGISIILFFNIISSGPRLFGLMLELLMNDFGHQVLWVLLALIIMLITITFVVFISNSERRLQVQYAKRQVGRKMYGGQNTFLPIKVLMSGVMPIIFASAIVSLPQTLAVIIPSWADFVNTWLSTSSWIYVVLLFVLIIAFAYFYISISFDCTEVANNLKKNGGTILGYRPGKPTADYIRKVVNRVTLLGAIFLSIIAIFPILMSWTGKEALMYIVFGGTSLIIIVGVALETTRDIESEITMRHYKGFLE